MLVQNSAKPVDPLVKLASPLIVPKKEPGTSSDKTHTAPPQHSFSTRRRSGVSKPRSAKVLWSTPSEVLSLDDDSSSIESWDD